MKKEYFELRIFICFVLTIFYVNYTVWANKSNEPAAARVAQEKAIKGFEVRLVNDHANERLELTQDLLNSACSSVVRANDS